MLVLDSLEDPQNVGTLLRSAEAAGVHGVLFPTHRQAPLSPSAVKASAGATEHLLLAPVDDLAGALADLHVRGLRVAGAEADAPLSMRETDLRGPLAIVVGSEGQGLGPAVRRRCDLTMRIPMRGAIGSLNAAVAGSILLFEALAQRGGERSPAPAAARIEDESGHEEVVPAAVVADAVEPVEPPEVVEAEAAAAEPEPEPVPAPSPAPRVRRTRKPVAPVESVAEPADDAEPAAEAAEPAPQQAPRVRRTKKAAIVDPEPVTEAEPARGDEPAPSDDGLLPGGPD